MDNGWTQEVERLKKEVNEAVTLAEQQALEIIRLKNEIDKLKARRIWDGKPPTHRNEQRQTEG